MSYCRHNNVITSSHINKSHQSLSIAGEENSSGRLRHYASDMSISDSAEVDTSMNTSSMLQPMATSSPSMSSPKYTARNEAQHLSSSLDSYFDQMGKENAERFRLNLEQQERRHRENMQVLQELVQTNKKLVDYMIAVAHQPPPPRTQNEQPPGDSYWPVYHIL